MYLTFFLTRLLCASSVQQARAFFIIIFFYFNFFFSSSTIFSFLNALIKTLQLPRRNHADKDALRKVTLITSHYIYSPPGLFRITGPKIKLPHTLIFSWGDQPSFNETMGAVWAGSPAYRKCTNPNKTLRSIIWTCILLIFIYRYFFKTLKIPYYSNYHIGVEVIKVKIN